MPNLARLLLPLLALLAAAPALAQNERAYDPKALSVYEDGKRLYDAKEYAGALEKFDEAAAIEPGAARWQYNRGLALKKLGRNGEAADALLRARDMDPQYKREEIDKKLQELGAAPPPPVGSEKVTDSSFFKVAVIAGGFILLVAGILGGILFLILRADRMKPPPTVPDLTRRLTAVSEGLAELEYALAWGEDDPKLREQHDQMTAMERKVWGQLRGLHGNQPQTLQVINNLVTSLEGALPRLQKSAGPRLANVPAEVRGSKTGCFFCGRLLASPSLQRPVRLQQGGEESVAVACPGCETKMKAGQMPEVLSLKGEATPKHWTDSGLSPVALRHGDQANVVSGSLGQLGPPSIYGKLGAAAAGGAVVALGAAALVNLDTLKETAQRVAATVAAARSASRDRGSMDRDHS